MTKSEITHDAGIDQLLEGLEPLSDEDEVRLEIQIRRDKPRETRHWVTKRSNNHGPYPWEGVDSARHSQARSTCE
ncbi:hypothetical protein M1403_03545 [Patescibacteria group bacterium]|nr:hypothetical protein [Patescibacteria group bacterium]